MSLNPSILKMDRADLEQLLLHQPETLLDEVQKLQMLVKQQKEKTA